jgi:hypothetical protein
MALENAPLLDAGADDELDARVNHGAAPATMSTSQITRTFRLGLAHLAKFRILYIIGVFAFIIDTSFMMGVAPTTRLLELGICREHYRTTDPSVIEPGGDVAELLCKIDVVQSRLAEVNGYIGMLAFLPG